MSTSGWKTSSIVFAMRSRSPVLTASSKRLNTALLSLRYRRRTSVRPVDRSWLELVEPAVQEAPFGRRGGQLERATIGRPGLVGAAEPSQQIGPGGMEVQVAV